MAKAICVEIRRLSSEQEKNRNVMPVTMSKLNEELDSSFLLRIIR